MYLDKRKSKDDVCVGFLRPNLGTLEANTHLVGPLLVMGMRFDNGDSQRIIEAAWREGMFDRPVFLSQEELEAMNWNAPTPVVPKAVAEQL